MLYCLRGEFAIFIIDIVPEFKRHTLIEAALRVDFT